MIDADRAREQQLRETVEHTESIDADCEPRWLARGVLFLLDQIAAERQAREALERALVAVQSQCAGHADEFSQRVWNIAEKAVQDVRALLPSAGEPK